jgi:ATP-dependent RNA helicase RhlE
MPASTDDYIHRIGRTGRVKKNGDAITFVTSDDTDKIRALERLLDAPLERLTLQGFDYARPAPDRGPRLSRQPRRYGTGSRRPVRHGQRRGVAQ